MKPLIIALVGESGVGKTALAYALKENLQIPYVVSYTTRPMREGEINGRDHWYVTDKEVPPIFKLLAYTVFGGYKYWTTPEQISDNAVSTYVIDEKGLLYLKEKWSDKFDIISIKIERPDNPVDITRRRRDLERIPYKDYDTIIVNYGTLEEFTCKASVIIYQLIKEHGTERR